MSEGNSTKQSEPSMEEILSSIKAIIAEDEGGSEAEGGASDHDAGPVADEVLELTESEEFAEKENAEGEQLLDDGKIANLANRFSTLQTLSEPGAAPQIVRSGETSLEELTRELLRPMLKEWLDTKLPEIVEAMVAREISRITKKG